MNKIWKFELYLQELCEIEIPVGSKILTIQIDKKTNTPCLWIIVDLGQMEKEIRQFRLYGTGQNIDILHTLEYIGTYQYSEGKFVGHLFELIRRKKHWSCLQRNGHE